MLRFLADLPVRAIAWLSDSLEMLLRVLGGFLSTGDSEDTDSPISVRRLVKRLLIGCFRCFAQLVVYPFSGFFYQGIRFRAFLWSLPFFLSCLGIASVLLVIGLNRERILNRYLARVQNAFSMQNGRLGVRYAQRWCDDKRFANPERMFLVTLVQIQAGEETSAERLLEQLSPDDGTGLGVAHYWRANKFAGKLQDGAIDEASREECLERFRWHLDRASGVRDAEISVLRALEAEWADRPDEAEAMYRAIWQKDPFQSLGFAKLLQRLGREEQRVEVLRSGANRMAILLRSDPWNRVIRGQLVSVCEALGDWPRAEFLWEEAMQLSRDPEVMASFIGFLDRRVRAALDSPVNYRELSYSLVRLLRFQSSSTETLSFISESLLNHEIDLELLQAEFNRWLVEGLDLPIVHLFLSVTKTLGGDVAVGQWHLQQSLRYDETTRKVIDALMEHLIDASEQLPEFHQRLLSAVAQESVPATIP